MPNNDYALIVGIDRYPTLGPGDTDLSLKGPGNDADAMEDWFTRQNVTVIDKITASIVDGNVQPTGDRIEAAMRAIDKLARENEARRNGLQVGRRLYIYISGHGFSPARRQGCIFTADANTLFGTNIHVSGWLEWFQDAGYFREFVLWMDCCMDRVTMQPPRMPSASVRSGGSPPKGEFIAFAAQRTLRAVEVPIPEDNNNWHGAFTWALLEGLKGAAVDANGLVTSRSLADWLRNAQSRFLGEDYLKDSRISTEPDIQEDSRLIFARGIRPRTYPVTLAFDPTLAGKRARLWSGRPPRPESFDILASGQIKSLRPGLYVVDVPDAGIRHGFEVVGAMQVKVEMAGKPVVPAQEGRIFNLHVEPAGHIAEIFIIDTVFSLVDSMPGQLTSPLFFGLYKIKVRVGSQVREHVILLDEDHRHFDAPVVVTAAPLAQTALGHVYQEVAAREAAQQARGLAEKTSLPVLTVMARVWSETPSPLHPPPWSEVRVVTGRGKTVLDVTRDGVLESAAKQDPYAVATAALEPGHYFLRRRARDGTLREQTLILPRGWSLEVYMLRRIAAEGGEPGRLMLSFHMRRQDDGKPDLAEDRLLEAAYAALADERRVVAGEFEELLRNQRNPMAGIVGAHLFLLEAERSGARDLSLLNDVVGNLRQLVGDEHPDVEALSLRCPDPALRARRQVKRPPIFHRSWDILTRATEERESLVPVAVWKRVHAVVPRPLYLAWVADAAIKRESLDALAQAVWTDPVPAAAPAALSEAPAPMQGFRMSVAADEGRVEIAAAGSTAPPTAKKRTARRSRPAAAVPPVAERVEVDPETARSRALRLGVPLSIVDLLRARGEPPDAPVAKPPVK